jgi:acetyltransferase
MGVLARYAGVKEALREEAAGECPDMPADLKEKARAIIAAVRAAGRTNLVETEARGILRCYGLDVSEDYLATSAEEAAAVQEDRGKVGMRSCPPTSCTRPTRAAWR